MTMKPEYNFGVKTIFTVILRGGKLGNDRQRLRDICSKNRLPAIKWGKLLDKEFDDGQYVWSWHGLSENACLELAEELDEIEANPEICEVPIYHAFQNDVLMADFARRYPRLKTEDYESFAQRDNDGISATLTYLQEYSLEQWAKAEKIDMAYRLTILPSIINVPEIIRVWIKHGDAHFVHCVSGNERQCKSDYRHYNEDSLSTDSWQKIQKFMLGNFWQSDTWYSHYRYNIRDGTSYLFEGWQKGEYKLLDDISPDDKQVSARAINLFKSIVE